MDFLTEHNRIGIEHTNKQLQFVYGYLENLESRSKDRFTAVLVQGNQRLQIEYLSDNEGEDLKGYVHDKSRVCVVLGTVVGGCSHQTMILRVRADQGGAIVPCEPNLVAYMKAVKYPGYRPGVVDACAGCGGWTVGQRAAGFQIQALADISPEAVQCAAANAPEADVFEADFN